MKTLVTYIITAVLNWLFSKLWSFGEFLIKFFKQKNKDEELDKKLETEENPAKREEISDEILNPKP